MPDFITLTCPSCGGKLKLTDKIHLVYCAHCGNEHMVVRDSGTIYLAPLAQDVRQIRVGVDKTAAELAVARLTREIDALQSERQAAITKASEERASNSKSENGWFVLGLLLLLLSACSAANDGGGFTRFLLFMGVGMIIITFLAHLYRSDKVDSWRNKEIARIDAEINKRLPSLEKNRQITES